jgi:DNA-binding transcriptional regulator YhcF (GntR family)
MAARRHTAQILEIALNREVPKYRQIIERVCQAVQAGQLRRGDRLPSINALSAAHGIARETVVKAYKRLKEMGLLVSLQGQGFHIATSQYRAAKRIFLLFDQFAPFKEKLYESMREAVRGQAQLDLRFHHFQPEVFVKLLEDAKGRYDYYVVMPFPHPAVRAALTGFNQSKLMLLDIDAQYPGKRCAAVLQNHGAELTRALTEAWPRLKRYRAVTLVFPEDKHHPVASKAAFRRFCRVHGIPGHIVPTFHPDDIHKRNAYFVIEDSDLVALVKSARQKHLKLGRDIGLLAYNDAPFKEIVQGGIDIVSIDFASLGRQAAKQILNPSPNCHILEPTHFIARGSL